MSVSSALFTDSQARVLERIFGHPERDFHLSELRRLTGLGSASLQRELNRLAAAGLVHSARVGNQRRFQANPDSPVFAELIAITRKTLGVVPVLRQHLTPLAPRIVLAYVYGSIAKSTDTAQSDIDLMLVGEPLTLGDTLEVLLPAEAELGRKINPTVLSPADYARRRGEPDSFVNRVLAQPVEALIGDPLGDRFGDLFRGATADRPARKPRASAGRSS